MGWMNKSMSNRAFVIAVACVVFVGAKGVVGGGSRLMVVEPPVDIRHAEFLG